MDNSTVEPRRHENGYVMIMTAMLLIPLLVFAALAVDVGGWTVQANRTQSAADAAALAGSPHLPHKLDAESAARDVAKLNGFSDSEVKVEFPDNQTIRVTVTDEAELHFASAVMDDSFEVTRFADATAVSPVTMGSPTNILGYGPNSIDGSDISNYWIIENNDCQLGHYGDARASQYLQWPWCGEALGLPENPEWKRKTDGRTGGYFYVVNVPKDATGPTRLWMFDPAQCEALGNKPKDKGWDEEGFGTELMFRSWDTQQTPLVDSDDLPSSPWWDPQDVPGACAADYAPGTPMDQRWVATPFVFPGNTSGDDETYLIQTRVKDHIQHPYAEGWNHHAFWVRPESNSYKSCLEIGSTNCATIGAEAWFATAAVGEAKNAPMDLYLANIGPEHAGKAFNVSIWDPGEGMSNIQVLDPNGKSLDFEWDSDDPINYGSNNPSSRCGGNPCLDLRPDFSRFPPKLRLPGWHNNWRFDGRKVTLRVPLNSQVDYPSYTSSPHGYWFRIRFNPMPDTTAREWASFSVQVTGDPIRLVE